MNARPARAAVAVALGVVAAVMSLVLVSVLLVVLDEDDQANACLATGAPVAGIAGAPLRVRVASWNSYYFNADPDVIAGLNDLATGADVIGLQELPPSEQNAVAAHLPAGFSLYTTPSNMTGIAWRSTAYDVVARGVEQSFGVEEVEDAASGTVIGPRSVLWMTMRAKSTGATFTVLNTHVVPSIDVNGKPDETKPRRLRLYQTQIDQVGRLTARFASTGPVFVTGDFNVDARDDAREQDPSFPYVRMAGFGLTSNWRELGYPGTGTERGGGSGRFIDYVWSSTAGVKALTQQVLPKHGSDHSPVAVTFASTGQPASTSSTSTSPASSSASAPAVASASNLPATVSAPGVRLSGEQVTNAGIIIAEGKAHDIPARGWVVAIAAALQESGMRMLSYGDRDSVNMFQQRPSAGWGTPAQLMDPHLATQAFYGVATHTNNSGLVDVPGWQAMSVTQAAQAVQRSAFPDAYAKWEPAAQAIVQQLTGVVDASSVDGTSLGAGCYGGTTQIGSCPATGSPVEQGLTPDALSVLRCAASSFPRIKTFYGLNSGESGDHGTGRAIDVMLSSAYSDVHSPQAETYGWQIANWARSNAQALGVHYVIYAAKIWNVDRDAEGWRPYASITGSNNDTSLHYDHVHVSVFGDQGTGRSAALGLGGGVSVAAGQWTMPLPAGTYVVGCGFGCYSGHTGQDFPVHSGTPVYASNDGVVVRSVALRSGGRYVSYGNLVVIRSSVGGDVEVYYAHLSQRLVSVGTQVRAGQQIGLSGFTGHVIPAGEGGAHLHYEIRVDGTPVDPLPILQSKGVTP